MLELLSKYGYKPPVLKEMKHKNVEVVDIGGHKERLQLRVNGEGWMTYNIHTHEEVFEVFSHYYLAKGDVVVTGMGFGARENWIVDKPGVDSLTVVEWSQDLIDYHKHIKSPFMEKATVLKQDARKLTVKCDVLILDHYEYENSNDILAEVKTIHDNCEFDIIWFWPFERIIMEARKWYSDHHNRLVTKLDAYYAIRQMYGLTKFPDLDAQTLNLFCFMFNSKITSNSEWHLRNNVITEDNLKQFI